MKKFTKSISIDISHIFIWCSILLFWRSIFINETPPLSTCEQISHNNYEFGPEPVKCLLKEKITLLFFSFLLSNLSETLSQSTKRSTLSPHKIRSFDLSSILLSLYPCFALISSLRFSFCSLSSCSISLCIFSLPLSLLLVEPWMQAADGWDVFRLRGIVLISFPILSPCQEVSKVGWRVIGNWQEESCQGLFRVALIDNCK